MSHLIQGLTAYISNTTTTLAPLTLPLAPIAPLTTFIDHVTTAHVHPTYFPFLRFGAIHAARVSLVWAGMTSGRKRPVSVLQDLFGYLVLAWGGGTIVSLLLSQPPSWLADPTPWLIYPPIYLLLIQTGIARYITSTAPTLINLFGAYIDGITRGTTITALPKALAAGTYGATSSSTSALGNNLWTTALMSGLAVASGGWIVQGLGLHESEWKVGKPAILSGSILDTLDLWSGVLTGIFYAALTRSHTSLNPVGDLLAQVLPAELVAHGVGAKGVVGPSTARAVSVLVLGSILAARVVTKTVLNYKNAVPRPVKQSREEILAELMDEKKDTAVVKNPVQVGGGSKATPRKNKKGGSSKSP